MDSVKQKAFAFVDHHRDDMIATWAALVNHESPSTDKAAVDGIAARIRDILAAEGAAARIVEFEHAGNLLVATIGAERASSPIALLGHYDTFMPIGTTRERPFAVRDGRAYGPGVVDMKGGVVILLYAVLALRAAGYDARPLKIILAGDEEVAHLRSDAAGRLHRQVNGTDGAGPRPGRAARQSCAGGLAAPARTGLGRNSLANLMTFPRLAKPVERGDIALHGAVFGVATGDLSVRDPSTGAFERVAAYEHARVFSTPRF